MDYLAGNVQLVIAIFDEITLAILSLIAVCGGYLLTLYFNLSDTGIFWVNLSFLLSIILMKMVFGV